jgi:hypothetical protein
MCILRLKKRLCQECCDLAKKLDEEWLQDQMSHHESLILGAKEFELDEDKRRHKSIGYKHRGRSLYHFIARPYKKEYVRKNGL